MKSATRSGISLKTKAEGTTLPSSKGLSTAQAELSRQKHGSNVLKVKKPKSFIRRFFENLGDPVIRILLLALAVDLIFVFRGGSIAETVGIAVSVFLAAFISALSEHGGENAFRRLSAECGRQEHRVFRNGALVTLPLEELTVGDIIVIGAGEKLPADGYILSGTLTVDQAVEEKCQGNEGGGNVSKTAYLLCKLGETELERAVTGVGLHLKGYPSKKGAVPNGKYLYLRFT